MNPLEMKVSRIETMELSLKSMKKAFVRQVWCSYCWSSVKESYFHCDICDEGDFDGCLSCYNQG
jgi:hypothetical protein